MKFTFLSVNMNTLYITIFDLSRKKIQFVNVLLVIHIMLRTIMPFQIKCKNMSNNRIDNMSSE